MNDHVIGCAELYVSSTVTTYRITINYGSRMARFFSRLILVFAKRQLTHMPHGQAGERPCQRLCGLALRSLHHYRITFNHGGCVAFLFSSLFLKTSFTFSQFLALGVSREAVHVTEMLARKSTRSATLHLHKERVSERARRRASSDTKAY